MVTGAEVTGIVGVVGPPVVGELPSPGGCDGGNGSPTEVGWVAGGIVTGGVVGGGELGGGGEHAVSPVT